VFSGSAGYALFDQFKPWRTHMTNQIQLVARSAQALLAVAATVASVIVFQFAMVMG
jgi:uncharacterized protein YukE